MEETAKKTSGAKTAAIIIVSAVFLIGIIVLIVMLTKSSKKQGWSAQPDASTDEKKTTLGFDWKFSPSGKKDEPKKDMFGNIIPTKDIYGNVISQPCFPKEWKYNMFTKRCEPPK